MTQQELRAAYNQISCLLQHAAVFARRIVKWCPPKQIQTHTKSTSFFKPVPCFLRSCSIVFAIVFPACYVIVYHLNCCLPPFLHFPSHSFPFSSFFHLEASCRTSHPLQNRVSGCLKISQNRHGETAKVHKGANTSIMKDVCFSSNFPIISAKDVPFDENRFQLAVVNSASKITGSDIWTSVTMPSSEDLRKPMD